MLIFFVTYDWVLLWILCVLQVYLDGFGNHYELLNVGLACKTAGRFLGSDLFRHILTCINLWYSS